jgi:hypothetical protein
MTVPTVMILFITMKEKPEEPVGYGQPQQNMKGPFVLSSCPRPIAAPRQLHPRQDLSQQNLSETNGIPQ